VEQFQCQSAAENLEKYLRKPLATLSGAGKLAPDESTKDHRGRGHQRACKPLPRPEPQRRR